MSSLVTVEQAKKMPRNYNEMPNEILLNMAIMGDQEAREERLIREIMAVDNVSWPEANLTFAKILESNRKVSNPTDTTTMLSNYLAADMTWLFFRVYSCSPCRTSLASLWRWEALWLLFQ